LQEKDQHESFIIHGRKTTFFVESSDSDIRKLVGNFVSEFTKKTTKYEPESLVFWGTAKVYFTLQPIKLTCSEQSRPFAVRSTMAFCEQLKVRYEN